MSEWKVPQPELLPAAYNVKEIMKKRGEKAE